MKKQLLLIFLLPLIFVQNTIFAQEAISPRPSPTAIVTMKFENTYVKVTYCQPHKRGRDIFGKLVPYGKVWRTGANEATEITTTKDIMLGGQKLKAGTYSIYTIPYKDKWTIIINEEVGQWGSYNYLKKSDVIRLDVPTQKITDVVYEPFTISFDQKNQEADMVMAWDKTRVHIPIKFLD